MSSYPGNDTSTSALAQSSQWSTGNTSLTAIFIALSIAVLSLLFRSSSDDKIYKLNGFYFVTAWSFFSKRYDFLKENFKKTGLKMFRFGLLQHRIIALAGETNRKVFFNDRSLDLSEGYRIFSPGIPKIEDVKMKEEDRENSDDDFAEVVKKRLSLLLRRERINEVLPLFFEDVGRRMKEWGTEGTMNPFNEVYELVFQMTVRMASCRELSEDREAVGRVAKLYAEVEKTTSPVNILLPWFPTFSKRTKQKATTALYDLLLSYINLRRKASTPSVDAIDLFITQGISDYSIIQTVMAIITAGVANTGVNSSWALLHLGTNPKWKRKAIDEFKALVEKHTNTLSLEPLHTRLSTIPLEAWEDELPSMDAIIRETLRISGSGTLFRRNIEKDLRIGAATIKRGDFVVYSTADVNLNPDIYPNPMNFDPDRFSPDREEDRKETFGYLSWGAGRHPCAGMKIAKLEMKLVLALILLGYEYELVDGNGKYPKALPDQDRNDVLQSRPMGDPCYLKFKRIVE